jgi:hypothetical protein
MFAENRWKIFLLGLLTLVILLVLFVFNSLEFLHFFIVRGEHTLFELPFALAVRGEFIVMLLISIPSLALSLFLLKTVSGPTLRNYLLGGLLVAFSVIKLFFYLPNMVFGGMSLWYILKQFPPIVFSVLVMVLAMLRLSDLKFRKYQ